MAPDHSSIQYRQIFWYHLIEETHSYPHVWKFPENILKYLYEGTFEKCKLFIYTHCISSKLLKKNTRIGSNRYMCIFVPDFHDNFLTLAICKEIFYEIFHNSKRFHASKIT